MFYKFKKKDFCLKNVIGPLEPWFSAWKPWSRFLPGPTENMYWGQMYDIEVTVVQRLKPRCEIRRKTFTLQILFSLLRILPQEWNTLGKNVWVKMLNVCFYFPSAMCLHSLGPTWKEILYNSCTTDSLFFLKYFQNVWFTPNFSLWALPPH